MVFTTRLSGGRGGRNGFENELHRLGVTQINSTPNHPTTCGKVCRRPPAPHRRRRTYTGTRVLILAQDLHLRIINAATGERLRELTRWTPQRTTNPPAPQRPKRKKARP